MKRLFTREKVRTWLMIVGTATLTLGAAYAMVQQSTRLGATDAPHRTADMAKRLLNNGSKPSSVEPGYVTHLPSDSSTFLTITNKNGAVLASNMLIEGTQTMDLPTTPPQGVFDYATAHGHDSITWQPFSNVRTVIYVEPYDKGYVVAGQSLNPFENRYKTYAAIAALAWLGVVVWVTFLLLV